MAEDRGATTTTAGPKSEKEVLRIFALLLNAQSNAGPSVLVVKTQPHHWSDIAWESDHINSNTYNARSDDDDDESDYGFSSFPSLSLEHTPDKEGEASDANVEARVASHLARPILVSNRALEVDDDEDESHNDNGCCAQEKEDFMSHSVSQVPNLMLQNFFKSFGTLMNSRLRAYVVFLAQHGLSLYKTSETVQELEGGVTSVEQKLETMLDIGNMVVSDAVTVEVTPHPERATASTREGEAEDAQQLCMPLTWKATIDIAIPNVFVPGRHMHLSVQFQTTGSITGVFPSDSPAKSRPPVIRVVQLDLDISQLLSCMREQAARVITCIIEMTNAAHSLPLPIIPVASDGQHILSLTASKRGAPEDIGASSRDVLTAKRVRIE